jgi:hypothetical protein
VSEKFCSNSLNNEIQYYLQASIEQKEGKIFQWPWENFPRPGSQALMAGICRKNTEILSSATSSCSCLEALTSLPANPREGRFYCHRDRAKAAQDNNSYSVMKYKSH